jgi:hypothetical protein
LLCTDEKDTLAKQAKNPFSIKPMQNKTKDKLQQHSVKQRVKTFVETKPNQLAKY